MTKQALVGRHLYNEFLDLTATERDALAFIQPLSLDYPGIENWFISKVVPGLRTGTRHLVRIERRGQIAALGIAKADGNETKICTVRIAPEFVGRGMGIRVFDDLMSWLGTGLPLATVSETKLNQFLRIFDHYGYRLTSVRTGLYVPGHAEYLFNEQLSPWGQPASSL